LIKYFTEIDMQPYQSIPKKNILFYIKNNTVLFPRNYWVIWHQIY